MIPSDISLRLMCQQRSRLRRSLRASLRLARFILLLDQLGLRPRDCNARRFAARCESAFGRFGCLMAEPWIVLVRPFRLCEKVERARLFRRVSRPAVDRLRRLDLFTSFFLKKKENKSINQVVAASGCLVGRQLVGRSPRPCRNSRARSTFSHKRKGRGIGLLGVSCAGSSDLHCIPTKGSVPAPG